MPEIISYPLSAELTFTATVFISGIFASVVPGFINSVLPKFNANDVAGNILSNIAIESNSDIPFVLNFIVLHLSFIYFLFCER